MANSTTTTYGDDCVLMLHMNGADGHTTFGDQSDSNHTVTANGSAQLDTAQQKFGSASGLFDGSGDYLSIPDSANWDFGTSDFTIDFWIRFVSGSSNAVLISRNGTSFRIKKQSSTIRIEWEGTTLWEVSWSPTDATWYHVAITRSGTNARLFIDGTQLGSTITNSSNIDEASELRVGSDGIEHDLNGWMDELRIVKGQAIWTANFTAPSSAYVADGAGAGGLSVLGRRPIRSHYRGVMR